jgi:formylglycine-generating enzyme
MLMHSQAWRGAVLVLAAALVLAGCSRPTCLDETSGSAAARLPSALSAAAGSTTDAVTGLPTRVTHTASGIALVLIPAGEFMMGVEGGEGLEVRHRRIVKRAFYLGETEVTVGQFRRFALATDYTTDAESGTAAEDADKVKGAFVTPADRVHKREWDERASWRNPFPRVSDHVLRDEHPVSQVSWNDAMAFCKHFGLELPTEAQWEYAYRAGATTRYPWGDDGGAGGRFMNGGDQSMARRFPQEAAAYPFDDRFPTHSPAASFDPNAWGLYDMAGNIEEWTSHDYKLDARRDGLDETAPAPTTSVRVLRGSTWFSSPEGSGPWNRYGMRPTSRRDFIGFRAAVNVDVK